MSKIDELIRELCPKGVKRVALSHVAHVEKGRQVNREILSDDFPYPVYNGGVSPSGRHIESNFPADTITVSQGGASAGYVSFVREPLWVGAHCYAVIPKPEILNRFLFFYLKMLEGKLQGSKYGAGIPALDKRTLTKLSIPLPPIEVQREIVSILDKFTQLEAELAAELVARNLQFVEYAERMLASVASVSDRVTFGDVATIKRGASPRPISKFISSAEDAIPWIKIGDVSVGSKFVTATKERVSKAGAAQSRVVRPGDFLLSNSMSFGRPYISKITGCIHDGWLAISDFQAHVDSYFLFHLLRSKKVQSEFQTRAGSGTVRNLNAEIVKSISLYLPSLEIQRQIAQALDAFEKFTSDQGSGVPAEIAARSKQYEYYRNKLLTFKELETA